MSSARPGERPLPVVVMVGFGGSRNFGDNAAFEPALIDALAAALFDLPNALGLDAHRHFLCGQSQMAAGGDIAFTAACARLHLAQRVVLPEPPERYLHAVNKRGEPDFDTATRARAQALLGEPHIVDVRVVGQGARREDRFEETNVELVRSSDVIIVLLPEEGDAGKAGGTASLRDAAVRQGRPVVELRWRQQDGSCSVRRVPGGVRRTPPGLPVDWDALWPSSQSRAPTGMPLAAADYLRALKDSGSRHAQRQRQLFKVLALTIVSTHLAATIMAVVAAIFLHHEQPAFALLLAAELGLLLVGQAAHLTTHYSKGTRRWAVSRLVAEVARSADALRGLPVPLTHLFQLPFPVAVQPLLRTVNLVHLASARDAPASWQEVRRRYVEQRLDGATGQARYYNDHQHGAARWHRVAQVAFYAAWAVAFIASAAKLAMALGLLNVPAGIEHEAVGHVLGALAIVLPVAAVSALSLDAAYDLEARHHTYHDVNQAIAVTRAALQDARSEPEFRSLVSELETRLLGETATWASRRSFTGVS
jgi:hypothetical protein